jgi:monoamine oxidase
LLDDRVAGAPPKPQSRAVSEGPGVLLASYSWNDNARQLGNLTQEAMTDLVAQDLARIHPELPDYQSDAKTMAWDRNPYTRGAFAVTPPGDIEAYMELGRRPVGNLYFAGEHVSIAQGWIQGALESGLREALYMIDPSEVYPPPLPIDVEEHL